MVNYKDLGLVNSREMFKKAMEGKYAIPAFNFNNMEQMQAIVAACVETKSPVILQVSSGARKYANQTILRYMAQGAVEYAKELGCNIPICLHLDHGDTYELCVSCIEMGFSSVMIDGSALPYDENVPVMRMESSFLLHYVSISWKKSKDVSPDSRSFSTDHPPYHKTKLLLSINMAVHEKTPWASRKSNYAGQPPLPYVKSISIRMVVWQ